MDDGRWAMDDGNDDLAITFAQLDSTWSLPGFWVIYYTG